MSDSDYPSSPHVRSHKPPKRAYPRYRACLRLEFGYRCVYCRTSEVEVRPVSPHGGFEIEHFRPQSRFKKAADRYQNLYWSCRLCNARKGEKWPNVAELQRGCRFVDPCNDSPSDHI